MRILKSMIISFSTYSKIPMPQFAWKEEDMKYMLCFFPWIGGVIGVCVYLWGMLCRHLEIGSLCYTLTGVLIPLLVTGGFHVDGFMDTMDAFHSYRPSEKKLEILKDSHIGAFAVIMLAAYGLLYAGAFSEIQNQKLLGVVCAGFFLSRALSGIGIMRLPSAKKEGMLFTFASTAHRRAVQISLYLQAFLCICFMLWQSPAAGGLLTAAALSTFAYYGYRSKKELGGITGDTAGYFVVLCEGSMVVTAAIFNILML